MIDFISKIKGSASVIRSLFPGKFKADLALIKNRTMPLPKEIKVLNEVKYSDIPHFEITREADPEAYSSAGQGNRDLIVYNRRLHYYDGVSMRSISHPSLCTEAPWHQENLALDEVSHQPEIQLRGTCDDL